MSSHLGECLVAYLPEQVLDLVAPCQRIWIFGIRLGNFCSWNPESGKFLLVKSGIQEIFACGIRNPGNFCSWNPESAKFYLVESGIPKIFARGIRNPEKFCSWNPESGKFLLVKSGIREIFACGIQILGFGIRNTAQRIRNPPDNWYSESRFHWQRIRNPVPGNRSPRRGIQNLRLSCLGANF